MDLERELARVLRAHTAPAPAADPVTAVRAGMARRRRHQRLSTSIAGALVVAVLGAAAWVLNDPQPTTQQQLAGDPVPDGFRASDLSWVSVEDGFALGTAACARGRCVHLLRTRDGGRTWSDTSGSGLPDGCDDACPTHVRFADRAVGYAFGPGLLMTTDGGATWSSQPGPSTYGLETARGTVVRVVTADGCPGCRFEVQRSAVGTNDWVTVHTSDEQRAGARLARQVDQVAVSLLANPAGGAGDAHISLLLSPDGGTTWTRRDDPCLDPATAGTDPDETDAAQVGLSLSGEVVVLCQRRGARSNGGNSTVVLSTDAGARFSTPTGFPEATDASLLAASGTGVLLAETRQGGSRAVVLQRSLDGGRTWAEVASTKQVDGLTDAAYLAFSTATVATWVPQPGGTVWRSLDAGATWTEHRFASDPR